MEIPKIKAPEAPIKKKTLSKHGDRRVDPYYWLRERKNPETMKYLRAENRYFNRAMEQVSALKTRLWKEMKGRIVETDSSPPAKWGAYYYYVRNIKGLQYSLYCRKKGLKGKEEIFIDGNKLAKGKKYFSLGGYDIAPSQDILAFAADYDGSEKHVIELKDLRSGRSVGEVTKDSSGSLVWAEDNLHLFYVVLDSNHRPYRVYRHELGAKKKDVLVYEEKDASQFLSLSKTASSAYILIESHGAITSEVWFVDANTPTQDFRLVQKRKRGVEYDLEHNGDYFYIRTNADRAKNFKVVRTPVEKPGKRNWQEYIKENPRRLISGIFMASEFLILSEKERALPQLRVIEIKGKKQHVAQFEEEAYNVSIAGGNYEFESDRLRISYQSFVTPASIIEYNLKTKKKKTLKTQKIPGGYSKSKFTTRRIYMKSHDGEKVPVTLVYKKGSSASGKTEPVKMRPCYLYAYGSYGASIPVNFSTTRLSLLERGFVFALAHIRGGSDLGRHWYEDGKFLKKKNTFKDFIAVAEGLIEQGWTSPEQLAIAGGSAGGMLMGAVANMRPDLFRAVCAHVPFVDVLNTMLDQSLPLTQIEFDEWGNPEDPKYYSYIKSYSPYDNVRAQDYPAMLVTAGISDPRVTYWEPAKWVAKLRKAKTDQNLLIFKTIMEGGHFGSSGRYEILKEVAEEYAFVMGLILGTKTK